MKKTFLVVAFALMGSAVMAQSGSGFGIKAGLSYNKNGDLIGSVGDGGQDIIEGAEGKTGYHFVFGENWISQKFTSDPNWCIPKPRVPTIFQMVDPKITMCPNWTCLCCWAIN